MFNWLLKAVTGSRDPSDDFWFTNVGPASSSGPMVSPETALSVSTVYACAKVISETAGQLPLKMFLRKPNGEKEQTPRHPLDDVIHMQPNDEHTALEFREMMTAWAALRGTAVAEIVPGVRGAVDQLIPIHPDHLRPVKVVDSSGRFRWQFEIHEPGAPPRRLLRSEVFILRAMATNPDCPLLGLDPLTAQRNTLGAALAAQDYASRFFANDARPSGLVKHPSYFKDGESRDTWVQAFQRAFTGRNRHRVALLEWGMEYQQVSVTPEQAQFLETRKFQQEDVARIFRVPPHKVGILERATNNNIEQQALEFVMDTMMPWLVRWEQCIRRDLITNRNFFAEHNVAGLLRGDLLTRYQAFAIARNWGWMSVNEIRKLENQNGIGPEGDVYLQPLNMTEAGQPPPDRNTPTRPVQPPTAGVWVPKTNGVDQHV